MTDASRLQALHQLRAALLQCRACPAMQPPPVSGLAVLSPVVLVGQAPGAKEPVVGKPFAWTAGKTLFRWFQDAAGISEGDFRSKIYMAAVCRCFPGKLPQGGDRVPDGGEIARCGTWMEKEFSLLQPRLVLPVGKLAIARFLPPAPLIEQVGQIFSTTAFGVSCDIIPLPHPSGASPWHRMEPGLTLLRRALDLTRTHPAFQQAMRLP